MNEIQHFVDSAARQLAAVGIDDPQDEYIFGLPDHDTAAQDLQLALQLIRRAERRMTEGDESVTKPETLPYTAIGYWDDDRIWVTGVVRGEHECGIGGDSPGTEEGAWGEHFHAADDLAAAEGAETLARLTSGNDDEDDEDKLPYYTEEAVEVKAHNGFVLGLVDITDDEVYLHATEDHIGSLVAEGPSLEDGWTWTDMDGKEGTANTQEGGLRFIWDAYLARTIAGHQAAR